MAYQYPPPSSGLDPSPGMLHSYQGYPPIPSPVGPSLSPTTSKHRANPLTAKSAKIKRSMSTPNVRGQAAADALSAEKRRNKLGYHRTSVACGHCRRRKIRCIPHQDSTQNRCSNCIRLKKECIYYPVDQQPSIETARRSSKAQSGTGQAPSETSSPSSSVHQPELHSNLSYTNLTMPPIHDHGADGKRHRTASFSPEVKGISQSRPFDYGQASTGWIPSDAASTATKGQTDMPQNYWRPQPQESPVTPGFAPYPSNLQIPPPQAWAGNHPEQSPREDLGWSSVPQRSTSYSNLEGLNSQQPYVPYSQAPTHNVGDNYTTKPRMMQTNMYPPPLSSSSGSFSAAEAVPQHSAGPVPSSHYQGWQQQNQYAYQQPGPTQFGEVTAAGPHYGYGEPAPSMYPAPPSHGR
ncbi:hypothetical protein BP6252_09123 [Coleophoma cylindrospora]|uniref:Zn(2)-C6 fungal-type domain-containing protein n=1 Tax=Coleophoma cylindrospora TaxID=1849047 RepID=A0A3D8R111_9HELO|nr:hypothetical protein BP6252_09123 [Coleophoma cylindrospora]